MTSKHFKPLDGEPDKVLVGLPKLRRAAEIDAAEPMTVVGRMAMQPALGIAAENERLKAERADGGVVVKLDPKCIGPSRFANRHSLSLEESDPDFKSLLETFRSDGQDQPIVVRPAPPAATGEPRYEVAFGHRRHKAALLLDSESPEGWTIEARIKPLTDLELILLMDRENEDRKGLSAYERGCQFRTWIREGVVKNASEVARLRHQTPQTITKYLQVADLPDEVLAAFRDPRQISLYWMQELMRVLNENRTAVLAEARELAASDVMVRADQVYARLIRAGAHSLGTDKPPADEEVIRLSRNRLGFKMVLRKGSVRFKFGGDVDEARQKAIAALMKRAGSVYLREHEPPPRERPPTKAKKK